MDLAESGELPAYKVAGVYLRFKRQQLEEFKKSRKAAALYKGEVPQKPSFKDKINDFFYFYDFYIVASLIIILMLVIIFQG